MAPPQVFVIDVDNGDKVFYPGTIVSGRVNLQTSDKKKLRGIYLTLVGHAYVHWSESVYHWDRGTQNDTPLCTIKTRSRTLTFG